MSSRIHFSTRFKLIAGFSVIILLMIAGLLITATGCGDGGTTGSETPESGRISLRNDTQYHSKATYIGKSE